MTALTLKLGLIRRLEAERGRHQMTQKQVAKRIGVKLSWYQDFENGKTSIPYFIVERLCRLYSIDMNTLPNDGFAIEPMPRISL